MANKNLTEYCNLLISRDIRMLKNVNLIYLGASNPISIDNMPTKTCFVINYFLAYSKA